MQAERHEHEHEADLQVGGLSTLFDVAFLRGVVGESLESEQR